MSVIGDLVREAFQWLEDSGFRYAGEDEGLPAYSISTFERGPIAVQVHWDGRDHATWTVVARGQRQLRSLSARHLGLSHLDPGGGPSAILLADPAFDPTPLAEVQAWDSDLLRTLGGSLLNGEETAWADLARLRAEHMTDETRS